MKTVRRRLTLVLLFVSLAALISAHAQITPAQDAYADSSKPTINFGAAATLGVTNTAASIQTTYIQFDLSSIPAGYTGANIAKASLKLYVNSVTAAGSFNVDYINGAWSEKTLNHNNAPALGGTIQASVPVMTGSKNSYLVVDVTAALQAWLNGAQTNDGIALVANSPLNASFDSNENTMQSHPAELDVVFNGTITGVNTAASSGLTGGGSSGTLNLSLLTSCSANQVLQWNGTSWVCSNVGTGTATSVGLSAPVSDFVVSGSPVTTAGMLNFAWTVPPSSSNTASAIVKRDSTGSFSATSINASGQISVNNGSSLNPIISQASAANAAAIVGYSTGVGLTDGVMGSTLSAGQGSSGVIGLDQNGNGSAGNYTAGVTGVTQNSFGIGVFGYGVLSGTGTNFLGSRRVGAWGDDAAGAGVLGTSDTGNGVLAFNSSTDHPTLFGQNFADGNAAMALNSSASATTLTAQNNTNASNGVIFKASAPNVQSNGSSAFCQVSTHGDLGCTGDVFQNSPANGLVKALVYFDPSQPVNSQIVRCFNSALAEPAASTPPCGFTDNHGAAGINTLDFGFTVNNRFAQVTAVWNANDNHEVTASFSAGGSSTQLIVRTFYASSSWNATTDTPFYLTVF